MIQLLLLFLLTSAISFAGSVQMGAVNMGVIRTVIEKDFRHGIYFAFGGCLPEIIYAWLAFEGTQLFWQSKTAQAVTIAALVVIGIYFIAAKPKAAPAAAVNGKRGSLFSGFMFGLLNPQLLPFWMVAISTLRGFNLAGSGHATGERMAVSLGAAAGAFVLLYMAAAITEKKKNALPAFLKSNYNRLLGAVLILAAVWQWWRME